MPRLPPGLYDKLVDRAVEAALGDIESGLSLVSPLALDEAHDHLVLAVATRLRGALRAVRGESVSDKLEGQVALTNRVLEVLSMVPSSGTDANDTIPAPPLRLSAVFEAAEAPQEPRSPQRPKIPLRSSDLLINGKHDLSLGPQLRLEIESADRVDLLCSFVKWSGLRIIEDVLRDHLQRRPGSVRVLTTTYMGATERRALEALIEMGADVRVSYDRSQTRLHAKAWLLHRESGFSTAFVGSSNLSAAAVLDGLEWNVRLAQADNASILQRFAAAFDQYWDDGSFRAYDPKTFSEAIRGERRERAAPFLRFDIEPKSHQARILDELEAERAAGHWRNLVVAATGTGKTVVAALDYRRLSKQLKRARLLFVAHRREILEQSHRTFQVALGDGGFGERLGDGQVPGEWTHVFANIQSLTPERLEALSPDAFDVVVVDEFHHAAAGSYDRLLQKLKPKVLVGLTATPERADGKSVLEWFEGRIASEIRLWEALDHSLLCPFQYFGIGSAPDLRGVKWSRGRYEPSALSNVYTADHMFALRVLQETQKKVADISSMRALGFCVDLAHARFMTDQFVARGVRAQMVSGKSSSAERDQVLRALSAGEVQVVFTVDLFNEGVDVPKVDTILFLRPTESATVFLQQLGRGLRHADGKEVCTVLDFIGHAHKNFRFDARYRAIVGGTRKELEQQVEAGFPALPAGCFIHLDALAQDAVLENVRTAVGGKQQALAEALRDLAGDGEPTLPQFLARTQTDLEDLYAKACCWTSLRRRAGLHEEPADDWEKVVERALSRMLHIDDDRLERFASLLNVATPPAGDASDPYQRLLYVALGQMRKSFHDLGTFWEDLWQRPWLREEMLELLRILKDRTRHLSSPMAPPLADVALRLHGTYSRDEIFAAFDERNKNGGVLRTQSGIHNVKSRKTELLFVELEKSEKHYSPSTLYNDFPITRSRFRWESQSAAHPETPAGRRYVAAKAGAEQKVVLFVRQRRKDSRGHTLPYLCLGLCTYAGHAGAKPMRIDWELDVAMPAWWFQETKAAGG